MRLITILLMTHAFACLVSAAEPTNLLKPFADTVSCNWEVREPAEGSITKKPREIRLTASKVDETDWHVQVYQTDLNLVEGEPYTVKFRVRSPDNRGYSLSATIGVEDYHEIGLRMNCLPPNTFVKKASLSRRRVWYRGSVGLASC